MRNPLDPFHAHEALDRTNLALEFIDMHLYSHPYIEANEDLQKDVEKASVLLCGVYQKIGEKHLGETPKPSSGNNPAAERWSWALVIALSMVIGAAGALGAAGVIKGLYRFFVA